MRKFVGLLLLIAGVVMLLLDAHVAYIRQAAAHGINVGASLLLIFAGMWVLMPAVARAFAKELVEAIPALGALWPGGRRQYDPPPKPGVPPPPSVTGEFAKDPTKPPPGGF